MSVTICCVILTVVFREHSEGPDAAVPLHLRRPDVLVRPRGPDLRVCPRGPQPAGRGVLELRRRSRGLKSGRGVARRVPGPGGSSGTPEGEPKADDATGRLFERKEPVYTLQWKVAITIIRLLARLERLLSP